MVTSRIAPRTRPATLGMTMALATVVNALFATSALADVAPGCAHASLSTASHPIAAGLLALGVGAAFLLWPRRRR